MPVPRDFRIMVMEVEAQPNEHYHDFNFVAGQGWTFGLRAAYVCAYGVYNVENIPQVKLQVELLTGYPQPVQVLDTDRSRQPVNGTLGPCGDGEGGPHANLEHDGSLFNPVGADLIAYKDGAELVRWSLPPVSATNEESFWSPGAAPSSAVLWYDEDATGNPIPVARAWFDPVAEGVTVTP